MSSLPALCEELRVHPDAEGVPVVNSRDVAEGFEKQHAHVLRDIEIILGNPNPDLDAGWFRPVSYLDTQGQPRPSYDLTRQGFTLLVMGWQGERAMGFKVRYIRAFDEMEAELLGQSNQVVTWDQHLQSIRELVAPLAVRFDSQDVAIERIETRVELMSGRIETRFDVLEADVTLIKQKVANRRRDAPDKVKQEHVDACIAMGGLCPGCGTTPVIVDGKKSPFAEFDHHWASSKADVDHTWLICKAKCHQPLTRGQITRDQMDARFKAYQDKRRLLPGYMPKLF